MHCFVEDVSQGVTTCLHACAAPHCVATDAKTVSWPHSVAIHSVLSAVPAASAGPEQLQLAILRSVCVSYQVTRVKGDNCHFLLSERAFGKAIL